mmetsp:Transcript_119739/g.187816  ORF Transcript_119739/g.187816 Transcript_119739/m.187816 type:complete len:223 (-) Transcript_119739:895-1563(-)
MPPVAPVRRIGPSREAAPEDVVKLEITSVAMLWAEAIKSSERTLGGLLHSANLRIPWRVPALRICCGDICKPEALNAAESCNVRRESRPIDARVSVSLTFLLPRTRATRRASTESSKERELSCSAGIICFARAVKSGFPVVVRGSGPKDHRFGTIHVGSSLPTWAAHCVESNSRPDAVSTHACITFTPDNSCTRTAAAVMPCMSTRALSTSSGHTRRPSTLH